MRGEEVGSRDAVGLGGVMRTILSACAKPLSNAHSHPAYIKQAGEGDPVGHPAERRAQGTARGEDLCWPFTPSGVFLWQPSRKRAELEADGVNGQHRAGSGCATPTGPTTPGWWR
jgi:hypothetical protein